MFGMEEVLSELNGDELNEQGLPPGFRFHPTDEELITFYLASKVFHATFSGLQIAEVDLNRCEPWELPDVAKMGEREWYFFSLRDRKYPTGLRTNRATGAGYWKATGKDREVYSAGNGALLGMKKTLVFYKGRAPRGIKTKWVMHEYRLDGDFSCHHKCKEGWVICRIFNKTSDKKSQLHQGRSYYHHHLIEATSSPPPAATCSLPPLPETPTSTLLEHQSLTPFLIQHHHQQDDLKTLINPFITSPQSHLFHPYQDLGIPKQCKSEANFSNFQSHDSNMQWVDKIHPNLIQNPSLFEIESNVLGFPVSAAMSDTVHDMSTSVAFTGAGGFHPGDFWPLDS